jgi:UDP-N-acetylmuramate--alanine ligase
MKKSLSHIDLIYFLGIGGIGMSAIARYFLKKGKIVAGYDKTATPLTERLKEEGAKIHFSDSAELAKKEIEKYARERILIVYTPAIPKDSLIYQYFLSEGFYLSKRAEILGVITDDTYTAAVAGTHGKTTTSTMLAHLLIEANYHCTAFLGGISGNYLNNFVSTENDGDLIVHDQMHPTVVEADEFDRSFLKLSPDIAAITSVDADHLDIYGTGDELIDSFQDFTACIKEGGILISKKGLNYVPKVVGDVKVFSYAINESADFYATDIKIIDGKYHFSLKSIVEEIKQIEVGLPGLHNVENAVAAAAMAQKMGVGADTIKQGLKSFKGVKRRFEYIVERKNSVYIDDYAHHPRELEACILSLRELYPQKKITGIFQPHLFSRTRDFATGFAQSLGLLDEVILMEIYPARELPIPGIDAHFLLGLIPLKHKRILSVQQILDAVEDESIEVLVTLGAGDIDQLVNPIKQKLEKLWA